MIDHKNPLGDFNLKLTIKKLLSVLPPRGRDILTARFGLGANPRRLTLEAIGKKYKITRERVRQIENYSLGLIRKSKEYGEERATFDKLAEALKILGGLVKESEFLNFVSPDKSLQAHVHFLLALGETFKKEKEDEEFHHRWHIDGRLAEKVHEAIRKLYENLKENEIVPEAKILAAFLEHLKDISEEYKSEEIIKRWLSVSKKLDKNVLNEWGRISSPQIRAKGVRDRAYLVIRKHGSPIHFQEVARLIEEIFKKKAHVATTHNELIKDPRFVLVGRGLYALAEWGYTRGVVREVIKSILEKKGPLDKNQIIELVLKERYVKPNTILVNLQNGKYFKKDREGTYHLAS